jgi:hypothetical protein
MKYVHTDLERICSREPVDFSTFLPGWLGSLYRAFVKSELKFNINHKCRMKKQYLRFPRFRGYTKCSICEHKFTKSEAPPQDIIK